MPATIDAAVTLGAEVEIEDPSGAHQRFRVEEFAENGSISAASPLGDALLGAHVGDTITVHAPRGAWQATVLAIA